MDPAKAYDVFLSHHHGDKPWAMTLKAALEKRALKVWLDIDEIPPGVYFAKALEKGLADCKSMALIVSPEAMRSGWVEREYYQAVRLATDGELKLIPVILRDAPMPGFANDLNWVDFRDLEEFEESVGKLVWGITHNKPRAASVREKARVYKVPPILPTDDPEDFIGRRKFLEWLRMKLAGKNGRALVYGAPGAGKTTLSKMFAHESRPDFEVIVFQTCGQRSVEEIAAELANQLELNVGMAAPEKQIESIQGALRRARALLILDDVWRGDIQKLVPQRAAGTVSVLCSSRAHSWPWVGRGDSIELTNFTDDDVKALFARKLGGGETEKNWTEIQKLAKRLGHLAVAISVAGDLLAESIAPFAKAAQGIEFKKLVKGIHDVPGLFDQAVKARPEHEHRLLKAMAVCAEEGFWLPLAVTISGLTESEGEAACAGLVASSLVRLVDRDRQRFQLHALLRAHLQDGTEELRERHATALLELFKNWRPRWRDCVETIGEVIPGSVNFWRLGRKDECLSLCWKGFALGRQVGEPVSAFDIMRQAESFFSDPKSMDEQDTLRIIYGCQALVLNDWGRLDEAMALHKKEEAICLGFDDKEGLQVSYGNQALILKTWGRLEEAMALHKMEEAICLECNYKEGLQVSYGNQALILKEWGRLEEAMILHKKQEELCLELGDKGGLQASYGSQALIVKEWGRLDEAMALHKQEEEICLEVGNKYGLERSYGNQALILGRLGRLDEAMALHKQREEICLELGDKYGLHASYGNQAVILHKWGRLEEAMALLKEMERICFELGNKGTLRICIFNQANILEAWGRGEEAKKLREESEAIRRELMKGSGVEEKGEA